MWQEVISEGTVSAAFSSPHSANFTGFASAVDLGVPTVSSFRYPALTWSRSPGMIRQGDPEMYGLALPLTGDAAIVQNRRHSVVRPTEFTLFSTSSPFECRHRPHDEPASRAGQQQAPPPTAKAISVLVPVSAVPLPRAKVSRLLAGRFPPEGMASLLTQFLLQVTTHPEQFRAADARQLGYMALDLISATLAQHLDCEQALPAEVQRQALRARIDAFITEHLGDADLSARTVAAAHHISLRTLYRLWEGEEASVAELIRLRRLDRCRRDLTSPLHASKPIYAIAARWGFLDKTSFTRLFRATYGTSPQDYRQQPQPD
ncbi:helix-turn-helix domain-containing protein [Micromonospora andamanensis]|uniref:helix-turn-helix domain-containing protein n=1 Tax=Micromonospora andamanensis TaxID=1287068 RepID=UPI00194F9E95|nr:helix-turn-helix domain-containing protein [Micromonospora andamanensis]GIJ41084.1 AraC family transcriptional regulator [Micromonospora andamanensis]